MKIQLVTEVPEVTEQSTLYITRKAVEEWWGTDYVGSFVITDTNNTVTKLAREFGPRENPVDTVEAPMLCANCLDTCVYSIKAGVADWFMPAEDGSMMVYSKNGAVLQLGTTIQTRTWGARSLDDGVWTAWKIFITDVNDSGLVSLSQGGTGVVTEAEFDPLIHKRTGSALGGSYLESMREATLYDRFEDMTELMVVNVSSVDVPEGTTHMEKIAEGVGLATVNKSRYDILLATTEGPKSFNIVSGTKTDPLVEYDMQSVNEIIVSNGGGRVRHFCNFTVGEDVGPGDDLSRWETIAYLPGASDKFFYLEFLINPSKYVLVNDNYPWLGRLTVRSPKAPETDIQFKNEISGKDDEFKKFRAGRNSVTGDVIIQVQFNYYDRNTNPVMVMNTSELIFGVTENSVVLPEDWVSLNRDHMTLESPEAFSFVEYTARFDN